MKSLQLQRTILLSILFLFGFFASQAQWSVVRNVYGGAMANDGAASFTIGDKGYIIAGTATSMVYEYDTATNKWTSLGAAPASISFPMSFVLNGYAYIIGGDTAGQVTAAVWRFDPKAGKNAWVKRKDFPGGPRNAGFGFAVGNAGYVGCGFDGSYIYDDVWKYDDVNDSWTKLAAHVPQALIFPAAFVSGNKAYVLTGGTAPSGVNEVSNMWCFDPSNATWTPKAAFGGGIRQCCFAFSNNGYGYAGGGQTNYTTVYKDMWRYNVGANSWTRVEDIPLPGLGVVFCGGQQCLCRSGRHLRGQRPQWYRQFLQVPDGEDNDCSESCKQQPPPICLSQPGAFRIEHTGCIAGRCKGIGI
jgi:N-acetylneuraminic acid mutarotase